MAFEEIRIETDYLNVIHKVSGDKEVIKYLQQGSPVVNERLFFFAKRDGKTSFYYKDEEYYLIRNPDSTYSIVEASQEDLKGSPII